MRDSLIFKAIYYIFYGIGWCIGGIFRLIFTGIRNLIRYIANKSN